MKPTTLDIKRTGDLGGERIAMGIDEHAMGHIMNVLTDLYSNPKLAVIREYSTNARDAHIAAGIPERPIEVTTPNGLSPFFTVKDFGPGLSLSDIEEIYSKYGASTKRGGNDQVGMLGLGCKSGLTYTSQFNVVSVKDGERVIVAVSRMDDGRGVMEVVQQEPSDEPSGVEIQVPAKRHDDFLGTCQDFFKFWDKGTVLLNGAAPSRVTGDKITDNLMVVDGLQKDYVVMGGVAYPVKDGIASSENVYKRWGVVAFVGIGDVNFTPSREDLHYTGRTKACLETLRKDFKENLAKVITADIANATSYDAAIQKYKRWTERFGKHMTDTVKYRGHLIETEWQMPYSGKTVTNNFGGVTQVQDTYISYSKGYGRGSVSKGNRQVKYDAVKETLCVINYPFDELPSSRREKIKFFMEQKGLDYRTIFFFPGDVPGGVWTSEVKKVDYADVKALKVPRTGVKYATGYRFKIVAADGSWTDTNHLDTNLPIVYFTPADYQTYDIGKNFSAMADTVQVIQLTRNRWDKFNRDFPTGVEIRSYVSGRAKAAEDALSDDDKVQIWLDGNGYRENFKKIDETKIKDPKIVSIIKAAKTPVVSKERTAYDKAKNLHRIVLKQYYPDISFDENPFDEYPLVTFPGYRQSFHEDNYLYITAKYQEMQKKKI